MITLKNSKNVRENQMGNQEWTMQRHWQHWAHKTRDEDNKLKTAQKTKKMSNQDATKKTGMNTGVYERENRMGNQEWTMQRLWQHWAHKTRDEDNKLKAQHNTEN